MKVGLALIESKPTDINFNLHNALATLQLAHNHQVELVLFAQDYFGTTPLTLNSSALFQIKIACVQYDLVVGIGYKNDNNESSYVLINKNGDVINESNFNIDPSIFYLNNIKTRIVIGQQGFNKLNESDFLIWPILIESTPDEWFNTDLAKFRNKANEISNESILINGVVEDHCYGGAFHLKDNVLFVNQPMQQIGLSILEI